MSKGVKKLSQKEKKKKPENVVVPHESSKKSGFRGGTVVEKCACVSSFQDKMYGPGMRVKNNKRGGSVRCTVCSAAKL